MYGQQTTNEQRKTTRTEFHRVSDPEFQLFLAAERQDAQSVLRDGPPAERTYAMLPVGARAGSTQLATLLPVSQWS